MRDEETFRREMPDLLLRLIRADHFSLVGYEMCPAKGTAVLADLVESDKRLPAGVVPEWERSVWTHPYTRYFIGGKAVTALKFSDFFTSRELRGSQYWELICRVLRYDRNMTLPVQTGRGIAAISYGRKGRDFTERDRNMLNLLRPHFNQAYQNARLYTERQLRNAKPLAHYGLLPREAEVARWVGCGKTNPEIATILQISPRTVEKHMERILTKLGVENRTAAALLVASGEML
ncbi:MAG TPA: LuxR C-terminal-related transcriptional regulator [Candidatus Acidoferrum sp.]|nr:LuxR C-terminal-related transcriptional regulator [Candidatus Acidoferrum sp.]